MTSKTTTKVEPNHFNLKGHDRNLPKDQIADLQQQRIDMGQHYMGTGAVEEESRPEMRNRANLLVQNSNSDSNLQMEPSIVKGSG